MTTQEAVANNPPRTTSSFRHATDAPKRTTPLGDGQPGTPPVPRIPLPKPDASPTFVSRRPQKTAWADLKAQYSITMLVGFVLALALLAGLFSVDMRFEGTDEPVTIEQQEIVAMQDIQQTEHMERAPLPPRPPVPVEVPNDYVIEDEPLNLDASLDLNATLNVAAAPPPPPESTDEAAAEDATDEVFVVVEEKPTMIGGLQAIYDKIRYPIAARQAGVEGRVFVQFIVDKEGNVVDPQVLRSPHSMLSEEALRVMHLVKFTPGRQRNQPVNVRMSLPIIFRLEGSSFR
jgi:protein TonB